MHDTEPVHVLDAERDLICDILRSLLSQGKASGLQILEQVFALHVVEDDIVRLTVFKQVNESDDVVMLAHLEDLNLSTLLEDLYWLHVLFLDRLDGHLLVCHLVGSQFDEAELALT